MVSIRIVGFAALACALPGLVACVIPEPGPSVEQELAEHHLSCLAPGRPAYSPAHVDCVTARYQERQRARDHLRSAVLPPPPPSPTPGTEPPAPWPDRTPYLI